MLKIYKTADFWAELDQSWKCASVTTGAALMELSLKTCSYACLQMQGVKNGVSCIAGMFLQYRKVGGGELVLQLNALFLEQGVKSRLGKS